MKQNVLITGTSSGFGKLTAITLAAKGLKVYAFMRDISGKNAGAAKELSAIPGIETIEIDVTDEGSARNAVTRIINNDGRIDILVNNAGIGAVALYEQFTTGEARRQFDTNFWGTVNCINAVLPFMRKSRSGLIINITSSLGRFAMPFSSFYCASKYAVEAISEVLRAELSMVGVDIAVIEPGAFPGTGFNNNTRTNAAGKIDIARDYGQTAVEYPALMLEMLDNSIKYNQAPDPQLVADAIYDTIVSNSNKRPFRTVVDGAVGGALTKYNEMANELHKNLLSVLNLGQLYRYQ